MVLRPRIKFLRNPQLGDWSIRHRKRTSIDGFSPLGFRHSLNPCRFRLRLNRGKNRYPWTTSDWFFGLFDVNIVAETTFGEAGLLPSLGLLDKSLLREISLRPQVGISAPAVRRNFYKTEHSRNYAAVLSLALNPLESEFL